jgi:hypothetical protein
MMLSKVAAEVEEEMRIEDEIISSAKKSSPQSDGDPTRRADGDNEGETVINIAELDEE